MKPPPNDPKSQLAVLARLLFSPREELLKEIDFDNLDLGAFVKQYANPPEPVDLELRSSIREDAVIREIARLLAEHKGTQVRVLDACCGVASLPKRVLRSVAPEAPRIAYWAVDRDTGCIETVKSQIEDYRAFASFSVLQRQAWDLSGLDGHSMDLIVLNNTLHEIPPHLYPGMFAVFNQLLDPERGRMCIVDMEILPADAPEAIAITWEGTEVQRFLDAGGLAPELTLHDKQMTVYQAHCKPAPHGVNQEDMRLEIGTLLRRKLSDAIIQRQRIEAALLSGRKDYRAWLVVTGTIARLAEEIAALGGL
jgi:ubiquinone/menaquinone biosynthesis C-methylase UbiE